MAVVDSSRAGQSALLTSDLNSALEMKVDLNLFMALYLQM